MVRQPRTPLILPSEGFRFATLDETIRFSTCEKEKTSNLQNATYHALNGLAHTGTGTIVFWNHCGLLGRARPLDVVRDGSAWDRFLLVLPCAPPYLEPRWSSLKLSHSSCVCQSNQVSRS